MSQQELLTKVIHTLDAMAIDYMVTGSVASSYHGEPRSTHDIDIVIALEARDIPRMLKSFPPPDYYLEEESIRDALASRNMFNLMGGRLAGDLFMGARQERSASAGIDREASAPAAA